MGRWNNIFDSSFMRTRWVQHLIFWILTLSFFSYITYLISQESGLDWLKEHYKRELYRFTVIFFAVYINLLVFIPSLFNKKKYFIYGLSIIVLIGGLAYFSQILFENSFDEPVINKRFPLEKLKFLPTVFPLAFFLILTSLMHFLRDWLKLKDVELELKEMERIKLAAELESLKSQINPHFLFNTLNNIYSHSLFDSKKTSQLVLQLSSLLSYVIYDCKDEYTTVEKEIEFLNNYIDLERVRVDEHVNINYVVKGEGEDKLIAPLLFIPIVENVFKHSLKSGEPKPEIKIELLVDNDKIILSTENLVDDDDKAIKEKGGVGMRNVRKRLELLYPNKHSFESSSKNGIFKTSLQVMF